MIAQKSIGQVLDIASVDDVVSEFVKLRRAGSNLKGLCPFHNEKTPSFVVSPAKGIYKCFGCGRSGGPLQFIMEHEGYSFVEAIRWLAARYQIELEETERSTEEKAAASHRESLYIINERATRHYREQLDTDEGKSIARSYYRERGLLQKTLDSFELGYAPDHPDLLIQVLGTEGFNLKSAQEIGLTTRSGERDFFRSRVIFPIHNLSGKVIALAGRTLRKDGSQPKYINSPESPIYEKRKVLYGLYQAKNAIRRMDRCLLVEGYMDVISLHQNGVEHVVATSGTALTQDQVRLIKRYTQQVTLLYDGDAAGIAAAQRGVEMLIQQDMNVLIAVLPERHDPDSFIRERGSAEFLRFIDEEASDFILFTARILHSESTARPDVRARHIHSVIETLSQIADPVRRALYVRECARIFEISEQSVIDALNQAIRRRVRDKQRDALREERIAQRAGQEAEEEAFQRGTAAPQLAPADEHWTERDLIRMLIHHGHKYVDTIRVYDYCMDRLGDTLREGLYSELYQNTLNLIHELAASEGEIIFSEYLLRSGNPEIEKLTIDLLSSPYDLSENWEKMWQITLQMQEMPELNHKLDAEQCILRFKLRRFQELSKQNQQRIAEYDAAGDEASVQKHLKVQKLIIQEIQDMSEALRSVVI